MASEAVKAVLSAEQECDSKIAEAGNSADVIISAAEKKANEIIDNAVLQAKLKAQSIIGDAEKKASEILSGNNSGVSDYSVDRTKYKAAVEAVRAKALDLKE
ncbi:MAG: hypothetical protein LUG85_06770 [Clostridiales bacterium]|nr:hypothetical protein [Clostridiales bacterium]